MRTPFVCGARELPAREGDPPALSSLGSPPRPARRDHAAPRPPVGAHQRVRKGHKISDRRTYPKPTSASGAARPARPARRPPAPPPHVLSVAQKPTHRRLTAALKTRRQPDGADRLVRGPPRRTGNP